MKTQKPQQLSDYIGQQYAKQGVVPQQAQQLGQKQAQKIIAPSKVKKPGNVTGQSKITNPGSQTVGVPPNKFAAKTIQTASRQAGKKQLPFKNSPTSW
jgi:hypothetical protein